MIPGIWIVGAMLAFSGAVLAEEKPGDLKPREARELGWATAQRVDSGQTGDELEKGVRQDLEEIRAGREPKPGGPDKELNRGLADKDAENFGRFVNEQLVKGLRGRDLAAAIHREHEVRKGPRPPDRADKPGKPESRPPHPAPGHGGGHGKGPKK